MLSVAVLAGCRSLYLLFDTFHVFIEIVPVKTVLLNRNAKPAVIYFNTLNDAALLDNKQCGKNNNEKNNLTH